MFVGGNTPSFLQLRRPDWTVRWIDFIQDSRAIATDLVLDWDNLNCLEWCCMWIEECTGVNPYEPFKERNKGLTGVLHTIKAEGFGTLDQLLGSYFPSAPVGLLQQGDIVMVPADWPQDSDSAITRVMPYACALADPPFYWAITPEGLGSGALYEGGSVHGFLVGGVR